MVALGWGRGGTEGVASVLMKSLGHLHMGRGRGRIREVSWQGRDRVS